MFRRLTTNTFPNCNQTEMINYDNPFGYSGADFIAVTTDRVVKAKIEWHIS